MATPAATASDARIAQDLQNREYQAAYGYPVPGPNPQAQAYPQGYPAQNIQVGSPVYPGHPAMAVPVQGVQYQYQPRSLSPRWVPGIIVPARTVQVAPEHLHLCDIVYRGNTVKFLAVIDFIFMFLFHGMFGVLLSVMPLCGYWGAKTYNKCCIWTYVTFLVLMVLGRFALWNQQVQEGGASGFLFLSAVVEFLIFLFVIRFARDVTKCTAEQIQTCILIQTGQYGFQQML